MDLSSDRIAAHNQAQLDHYAADPAGNPRIRPVDSPYVRRHVQRMIDFAGLRPGEEILDVGCGAGKFTLPLLRGGLSVAGVDLSPELLDIVGQQLAPGEELERHCADLLHLPAALSGRFDAVVGFFVLHHMVDLEAAFRALRGVLRPGGRVAFLEPNGLNPLYYLQITFTPGMSWRADRGVARMTQGRLTSALRDAGFTDVRADRQGALPPMLLNRRWGPAAEDALGRVRPLRRFAAFQLVGATAPT